MKMSLLNKFTDGKGKKILIMLEVYPFFVVGTLVEVNSEEIGVKVEFGVPYPLKDKVFHIQVDQIAVCYLENQHGEIPTNW